MPRSSRPLGRKTRSVRAARLPDPTDGNLSDPSLSSQRSRQDPTPGEISTGKPGYRGRESDGLKRLLKAYVFEVGICKPKFPCGAARGPRRFGSAALLDPDRCRYGTSNRLPEWKLHPRMAAETGLHRAKVAGPGRVVKNLIRDAIRRDVRLSRHPTRGDPFRPASRDLARTVDLVGCDQKWRT